MSKRFEIIDHTADIGITARGQSLAEAFGNAAYGLFSIIAQLNRVRLTETKVIEVTGEDIEVLFFNWMNQLIYLFDVERLIFRDFQVAELDDTHLKAMCTGERYDPARHRLKIGVKSATYHMLEVDREKNTVQVIFDV